MTAESTPADRGMTDVTPADAIASAGVTPPAEPDAGDADGLSDLRDVIESGWEDEPNEAERELSATVARNVLSDWLATRVRGAEQRGAEKAGERIARAIEADATEGWGGSGIRAMNRAARIARADATRDTP